MDKPRLADAATFTFQESAQGGANIGIGLTNVAHAIMYAADVLAEAIAQRSADDRVMQKGND